MVVRLGTWVRVERGEGMGLPYQCGKSILDVFIVGSHVDIGDITDRRVGANARFFDLFDKFRF